MIEKLIQRKIELKQNLQLNRQIVNKLKMRKKLQIEKYLPTCIFKLEKRSFYSNFFNYKKFFQNFFFKIKYQDYMYV